MPIRKPTVTRELSQLGLASDGRLSKGYAMFKSQELANPPGAEATNEQTSAAAARYGQISDDAQRRALNAIGQVTGKDKYSDARAAYFARMAPGRAVPRFDPINAIPFGPDEPVKQQLPSLVTKEIISEAGTIIPSWHLVRNLPGYLLEPIRIIGRQALSAFSNTEMEDIKLNCTLSNAESEVRAVTNWIGAHGTRIPLPDKDLMTFAGMFNIANEPEYEANLRLYQVGQHDFLIVADPYGLYVYTYPTADRKLDLHMHIEAEETFTPRLGR